MTPRRVIAVVCDRCGYVEAPVFEGVTYRHCKAEMRPMGRLEYHRMLGSVFDHDSPHFALSDALASVAIYRELVGRAKR